MSRRELLRLFGGGAAVAVSPTLPTAEALDTRRVDVVVDGALRSGECAAAEIVPRYKVAQR